MVFKAELQIPLSRTDKLSEAKFRLSRTLKPSRLKENPEGYSET
jgi:hypothetical protein